MNLTADSFTLRFKCWKFVPVLAKMCPLISLEKKMFLLSVHAIVSVKSVFKSDLTVPISPKGENNRIFVGSWMVMNVVWMLAMI